MTAERTLNLAAMIDRKPDRSKRKIVDRSSHVQDARNSVVPRMRDWHREHKPHVSSKATRCERHNLELDRLWEGGRTCDACFAEGLELLGVEWSERWSGATDGELTNICGFLAAVFTNPDPSRSDIDTIRGYLKRHPGCSVVDLLAGTTLSKDATPSMVRQWLKHGDIPGVISTRKYGVRLRG